LTVNETTSPSHREPQPRIGVVIVTYNSARVLGSCLRSLPSRGVRLTGVVVADNASRDDSVAIAEASTELPICVVRLGRNAGFAAGVNAGMAALDFRTVDAVLIINPDATLRPDTIAVLWRALGRPRCGIAVPRLVNPDGSLQPSLRRAPTVRRALAEAVIGGERAGRFGSLGELVTNPDDYERPGPAVWATGAAMLISAQAVRDIGPWDESFLLYSEETEFALRAADRGWMLWYEPAAVVEHIGGESGTNPALAALAVVNKVRLFRRRRGVVASTAYYLAIVFGEAIRAVGGRRTARASVVALVRPSRRQGALAE
jgi:GT2 family glycosyltransferase